MTVEKTNAQEREALQKIKEILKDFDPKETYVGKAFEGCVELAKENIDNDWLYSWKGRYLDEQAKNCKLSDKLSTSEEHRVELVNQLNQKDDAIARLEDAKNQLESQIVGEALIRRDYDARIGQMKSDYKALQISCEGLKAAKKQEAAAEISDLKQTILELKAKLYDMMTGKEVEA